MIVAGCESFEFVSDDALTLPDGFRHDYGARTALLARIISAIG